MVCFSGGDAGSVAVGYCGTARMVQKELQRLRNNHLQALRGVQVLVQSRADAVGRNTLTVTFSHQEMDDPRKSAIRGIVQAEDFNSWLVERLRNRHSWRSLRVRVTSREKMKEYVWSIEEVAGEG